MHSDQRSAESSSGAYGASHRVRDVVELEVEENLAALIPELADDARSGRREELAPDLVEAAAIPQPSCEGESQLGVRHVEGHDWDRRHTGHLTLAIPVFLSLRSRTSPHAPRARRRARRRRAR